LDFLLRLLSDSELIEVAHLPTLTPAETDPLVPKFLLRLSLMLTIPAFPAASNLDEGG
jgi:hypothetical protein